MGLLDKMFGGGTGVELQLDATQVPVGGMLGGRVTVRGGKKDLQLTSLNVRLLYVCVTAKEGSAIPDIDTRILLNNALTANQALPAGAEQTYDFRFEIPGGTNPTAHNVSYKVTAVADIPGVKDPSSTVDLKVVEGVGVASLEEIYMRWPALRGTAPRPIVDALWDFRNACYGEKEVLLVAEPLLAGLIRNGAPEVRGPALDAWATLVDGQVRKEHLRLLADLVSADLDEAMTKKVVEAAAKFADEGALEYVQGYARHPNPTIRRELAQALRFAAADKFKGKRELLIAMAPDPDAGVREAVWAAFSDYRNDPQIMQMCAAQIDADPSPDVQAACIGTLCFGHHHGLAELSFSVYERHLGNQHERVRKEIAENVHWLGKDHTQRIGPIVQRLLGDPVEEVRRTMAWQFRNMGDFPSFAPMLMYVIEHDPSSEVRKDALGALASVVPVGEAVAYYRARMQGEPTEAIHRAVLDGVRWKDEPEAKQLLRELTSSHFASVAQSARDALE
jgi:HEAT repeat protein